MRVVVRDTVYEALDDFYAAAMKQHPTVDLQTVLKKEERLYRALESLGNTYYLYQFCVSCSGFVIRRISGSGRGCTS